MCPRICSAAPGASHNNHMNDRSHQVCKWTKDMTPRPQAYEACTKGYESGYRNALAFAKHTHENHDDSKTTQADLSAADAEEKAAEAEANKAADATTAAIKAKAAAAAKAASDAELKKIADAAKAESSKPASADELKNARAAARAAYAKEQARKKAGDSGVDV